MHVQVHKLPGAAGEKYHIKKHEVMGAAVAQLVTELICTGIQYVQYSWEQRFESGLQPFPNPIFLSPSHFLSDPCPVNKGLKSPPVNL